MKERHICCDSIALQLNELFLLPLSPITELVVFYACVYKNCDCGLGKVSE